LCDRVVLYVVPMPYQLCKNCWELKLLTKARKRVLTSLKLPTQLVVGDP
jgi:hypothetical protein